MSSDDSDAGPHHKRKRKTRRITESPPGSSSSVSPVIGSSSRSPVIGFSRSRRRPFRERNPIPDSSDSDSDSGSSIRRYNKRKKVGRVTSETESDSSDSIIITKRSKRTGRIPSESDVGTEASDRGFEGSSSSQWETDLSETEEQPPTSKPAPSVATTAADANVDSDSSDGQSEKCPICLLSFKTQEIGTPESCDHVFCLECIQEWSKNVNTCPVDRQEYNLILVRKSIAGKVIKQVPIEKPAPQNDVDIVEDPTFCEICGTSDNEDRMLLCDGCDLGFHLYCLRPPLTDVPAGAWYCDECSPDDEYDTDIEMYQIQLLLDQAETAASRLLHGGRRRNRLPRLVPRTRQSERVRRRIANNRQQNSLGERPSISEEFQLVGTVSSTSSRVSRSRKPKKNKKRKPRIRYKTVYEIDPATGETVAKKKRQKRSKRNRKAPRRSREAVRPKTVKKRLAAQLGICAPRSVPQSLPDVRAGIASNTLGGMRHQAGIPTLHLFGQNNQLDYFSGEEEDYHLGGSEVLIGRAPHRSDVSALRRVARRKGVLTASSTVSSSTDLLDSILNSQELFHSRNSSYHVDSSGKFKIENSKSNGYVDVNKETASVKQRPNSYQNQGRGNPGYNPGGEYRSHNYSQYHSTPTSTMESAASAVNYSSGTPEDYEAPQDYTQRTLCASYDVTQEKKDEDSTTDPNTPNSESEIDIYSDIETVSTSRADDGDLRPPSPPIISNTPNTGTDDENNDSEPDMVIDDDKLQEPEKGQDYSGEEAAVTSTVSFNTEYVPTPAVIPQSTHLEITHSSVQMPSETEAEMVQSSSLDNKANDYDEDSADGCPNTSIYSKESMEALKDTDDIDSDDGCPNFSIYSKESKTVALHTDISLSAEDNLPEQQSDQVGEVSSSPNVDVSHTSETETAPLENPDENENPNQRASVVDRFINARPETDFDSCEDVVPRRRKTSSAQPPKDLVKGGVLGGLYSDSEDEDVVKKGETPFALTDINHMTEDISEEERSYTPCLDERGHRQGLDGLDTEMISDEDRNDFDESHEHKTISDGDALEINAKESELDFTRPEDYEEGEIVDKNKAAKKPEETAVEKKKPKSKKDEESKKPKKKEKDKTAIEDEKGGNKENEGHREASFKKLSKSNKERNYRDKDKDSERQPSPEKPKDDKKDKKREKRKELERYNVRALIADKPRPLIIKDQFGRDIRRTPSRSRSNSYTPPINRSPSRGRKSASPRRRSSSPKTRRSTSRPASVTRMRKSPSKVMDMRKRRGRSRHRSLTRSRSRSPNNKKRSSSKRSRKRKRSSSRYGKRRKSSRNKYKGKKKSRPRRGSRSRSRTPSPARRKRDWSRREWTPMSMSRSPEPRLNASPSWTPPAIMDTSQALRNQNFTVVVDNSNKKKVKRRKTDKRTKKAGDARPKKRRRERERTPPPSKEVFASGDNILVSVSFNNENETRDVTTRDRRKKDDETAKKRREKRLSKNRRDLTGVKPVAIIDLERSPFKEITPSPKDVIVLSDSDNNDNEGGRNAQKNICDSSQQVVSPERSMNYPMGPKTPPEPQVKFSLTAKPPQVRAITNPLHEPDDMENNDEAQDEIDQRMNEGLHKGPNTPPEPPNSPPSSPDAYDPFEPTKSRSPTPEPMQSGQLNSNINLEDANVIDSRNAIDMLEKCTNPPRDTIKSLTPPIADIQPADSQSSIQATPESNIGKSPERIGVLINQTVQPALSTSKPVAQTTPFSSVPTSMITSTPVSSNLAPTRINILNSTIITPPHVASSIPQRIVLPNQVKSSPVKISPTKAAIKSTPIKPMLSKANKSGNRKNRTQNGSSADDLNLDFDSPYSPGSSDYEDLFEPPPDNAKPAGKSASKTTTTSKSPQKHQTVFDNLFGSPSFNLKNKGKNDKAKFGNKSKPFSSGKTKTVGVKLDEDNLKILDELPNSAVEMQVKDKFLKKLNRQERVVEEVKLVLKPHYNKKRINKEEYKDILRRSVPKICHNKSGEINPTKIKNLIEAYVKKIRHSKKVTSSSSVNPQKA